MTYSGPEESAFAAPEPDVGALETLTPTAELPRDDWKALTAALGEADRQSTQLRGMRGRVDAYRTDRLEQERRWAARLRRIDAIRHKLALKRQAGAASA